MADIFSLQCDALPLGALVISFRGREAINVPYHFLIGLLTAGGDAVDMDDLVGQSATLVIDAPDHETPQRFHGVLASVEHLHEATGKAVFELTLVPRLWYLTQTHHSRVFVEQTVPEILSAVLESNGIQAVDMKLRGAYPTMPFVCQYRESDLAFITRWMEREGMHYFFEQGDEEETLVITDHKEAHQTLAERPVRFVSAAAGAMKRGEALTHWRGRSRMLPASVTLRDYDYANPSLDVRGAAPVLRTGRGEIHLHGQNFSSPGEGQRLADVRAGEMMSRRKVFHGHGRVFQLRPGYTFQLDEHPRSAFNAGYLVTELDHHGNQAVDDASLQELLGLEHEEEYRVDVVAVPATVEFRPERLTAWPRIYGTENGVIDGPAASAYAQINTDGCYKVKIDFDESGLSGGGASCWIRMLQPHGGSNEGFHFPLRAGTEVLLTFLGGDPDQPVISGVLPNATKASPITADSHTKNVIQSGGLNRLEMEDLDGSQHVRLNTPTENTVVHMGAPIEGYNVDVKTDGDAQWKSGRNYDETVGGDNTKKVVGEVSRTYDKSEETHIKQNRFTRIDGSYDKTIGGPQATTVEGEVSKTYKNKYRKTVDQGYHRRVGTGTYFEDIADDGKFEAATSETWTTTAKLSHTIQAGSFSLYAGAVDPVTSQSGTVSTKTYELDINAGGPQFKEIIRGDREIEVRGSNTFKIFNDNDHHYLSNSKTFNYGSQAGVYLGDQTSTFVGAQNSTFLGFKLGLTAAIDIEISLAAKMAFNWAIAYERTAAMKFEMTKGTKFDLGSSVKDRKLVVKKQGATLAAGEVDVTTYSGLKSVAASLFVVK